MMLQLLLCVLVGRRGLGVGAGWGWGLDAPAHPSATILWPQVTCFHIMGHLWVLEGPLRCPWGFHLWLNILSIFPLTSWQWRMNQCIPWLLKNDHFSNLQCFWLFLSSCALRGPITAISTIAFLPPTHTKWQWIMSQYITTDQKRMSFLSIFFLLWAISEFLGVP